MEDEDIAMGNQDWLRMASSAEKVKYIFYI